ncbi:MAG TPA: aconitase family protein [Solirubrobacteraceae bacterium]|nr:aconitase family protein [Solirubrobacteraceae bacterium]
MIAVAMTMIEKILARAAGRDHVQVGELVVCEVDMTVLIDLQSATMWASPTRIADADRLAVIMDHAVPAPTIADADGGVRARAFVQQHASKRFFDVGRHGICHQVIAENGLARPGEILTCSDSHTCAGGAYNNAARGLGPAEVYSIMCTGKTWFQIAPTVRYELLGERPAVITGRDIFLHIAGTYGDATNHNLEFGGDGLAAVPMSDRRTIATQGAEISADFTTFPADERCREFIGAHSDDRAYEPADPDPDPDARYRGGPRGRPVHARAPGRPPGRGGAQRAAGLADRAPAGRPVLHRLVRQRAAGGRAHRRRVARRPPGRPGGPADRHARVPGVYTEAIRRGYLEAIAESGAIVTNSTCGACFGYHMGLLGPARSA